MKIITKIILTVIIGACLGSLIGHIQNTFNENGRQIEHLSKKVNQLEGELVDNDLILGSTNFVGGGAYRLSGSGISASATSVELQSFQIPVSGEELSMSDFGSIGYATVEPGTSKKEFISFTGVSQSASSDKCTLTGVTRGLQFTSPYTASSSLAQAHSGGSKLIISNPPQLYNRMAVKDNNETITGTWTFNELMTLDSYEAPTNDAQFAPKAYVDAVATSGADQASYDTSGLSELATTSELIVGTATSSATTYLVVPSDLVHQTSSATEIIPITNSSGKLDQDFLDLTEAFVFTGAIQASSTLDVGGAVTFNSTLTVASTTAFSDIPTIPTTTPTSDDEVTSKKYVDDTFWNIGTTTEVSGSRALNTDYQNTEGEWMMVLVTVTLSQNVGDDTIALGQIGSATDSYATVADLRVTYWDEQGGYDPASITKQGIMMVPDGYYYQVVTSGSGGVSIAEWWEIY